ncbi:MAG: hypothetical protein NT007_07030, partial [Candidatus Kapabacteria bacterium]|nr:hypothetical protein [Candidatus Kapabacteria bacterium]
MKKIKEKAQNLQSDNIIAFYITPKQTDSAAPSNEMQVKIIEELNKLEVIKIINRISYKNDNTGTFQKYEFKILPKFYDEYNKIGSVQKQDSEPKAVDSNLQLT